jgi:ribosomal protein L18E
MKDPFAFLDDQIIRKEISKALESGKTDRAINGLKRLKSVEAKTEECDFVFGYCIKSKALDNATEVANECWQGSRKQDALREIATRRLE